MRVDVPVIIGAGPGGVAAAITLAQAGIASLLLDKHTFPRDKICGDALSGKVVEVLNQFHPDWIKEFYHHQPQIPSWGVRFFAPNGECLDLPFKKDFDPNTISPGFICKRTNFDHWWLQKALTFPQIDFRPDYQLKTLERAGKNIILSFTNGQTIETPCVIGADGAQSVIARKLHQSNLPLAETCGGLRQYYQGVTGLHSHGFIELHFLKRLLPGYFWIFPLQNGVTNVGLGVRSDVVSRKKMNLKQLLEEVITQEPTISTRFQNAKPLESVKGFGLPLGMKKRPISGDGYVLVGDAGALIDPFTGEGIGNALVSGRLAGKRIAELMNQKADFSRTNLQTYDDAVYARLWDELRLSRTLQKLCQYPALFNFVCRKANRNATLKETMMAMFEDVDLRQRFQNPSFYWKLLFH